MPPETEDPDQSIEKDACGIGFVADLSAPAGGSSAGRGQPATPTNARATAAAS